MILASTINIIISLVIALALLGVLIYILARSARSKNAADEESTLEYLKSYGIAYKIPAEEVKVVSKKFLEERKASTVKGVVEDMPDVGPDEVIPVQVEMSQLVVDVEHDGKKREFFTPVHEITEAELQAAVAARETILLYVHPIHPDRYIFDFNLSHYLPGSNA